MSSEAVEAVERSDRKAPESGRPIRRSVSQQGIMQRFALLFAWAAVIVVFGILRPDTYLTLGNAQNIFGSQAVLLIVSLGLLVPLTTGDFDLSIAGNLAFSAMIVAVLQVNLGVPLILAMLVAVSVSLLVGLINGVIVVKLGINSFIVTLGASTILQGSVLWISGGNTIPGVSPDLIAWTIGHRFLGISLIFWYGLVFTIVLWYLMRRTALGRRLLFVGQGPNVARLSGVNVDRIRIGALMTSAGVAGLAGIAYAGTLGSVDVTSGFGFLLPAFAAAFLGATAIEPGRFNAWGTFCAVFFLVSGITGLQMMGVDSFVQQLFYGAALMIAVALSELSRRRRLRRLGGASA